MHRRGRYAYPEYDEEEAKDWQGCYFDSGKAYDHAVKTGGLKNPLTVDGPEGADDPEPIKDHTNVGGPEGADDPGEDDQEDRVEVTMEGTRPGVRFKLVAYGSPQELLELLQQPGRAAPPEGIGAAWYDGGAGLPIPEGCSSTARMNGQDGQSDPGDV